LLFVFRLNGGEAERTIRLEGLQAETVYRVRSEDRGFVLERTMMDAGLAFAGMEEESSDLLWISAV